MPKKQRGKGPNPHKNAERQTRKALRAQRRGKNYTDKDLKTFSRILADSGLVLREMKGDGNCFFRAVSDQLDGTQHNHAIYRARVCNHMDEMREFYAPFVEDEDETFDDYMTRMRSDCEWAGQPELQAMATVGRVDIMVHQFEAPSYVVTGSTSGKMIHVSYHDGQHYNSVHPTGAVAAKLDRPGASNVAFAKPDSDVTPEGVYARAVSALGIQSAVTVPSPRALVIVRSVLQDMGGDSDAAHEFLLVDLEFRAVCVAQPEPEPEPEPEQKSEALAVAEQSWTVDEQRRFETGLASFSKELGQERWVQIAALLESRTAGECKARYRQLSKEVKARKESLSAQQQMEGSGNGSEVDGVDAAARAKADRLLQLQVDAGTTSGTATKVQGVHVRAVPAVSAEIIVGTREHNSKDDAGAKEAPRKMKPSERRALKKAEKTARLEAKARKRAAAAASNGGSSDDEETGGIGQGNDTPGGGLGWGVIEL